MKKSNFIPPPPGATLDQRKSRAIAKDPKRLSGSFDYWSARFKEMGEALFEESETPGLKLLKNAPLYCLSSMSNIAKHVYGRQSAVEKMLKDIQTFYKISNAPNDPFAPPWLRRKLFKQNIESVQKAIRAVREIYDGCRRYIYCEKNSKEFKIPIYELLALYFHEGVFAVTPPESSFEHAPLIKTRSQKCVCRTSKVTLSNETAERPGFNLVYIPEYVGKNKEDLRYESLLWNLLVLGGLDVIVRGGFLVKKNDDNKNDDNFRFQVISNVYKRISKPTSRNSEITDVTKNLLVGLAVAKIEDFAVRHKDKLKEIDWKSLDEKFWDSFYKEVAGEFNELIQWHESDFLQYKGKKYAYIKGQLCFHEDGRFKGDDTYGCLRVQAQWYSTRRFPFTLLAYRDRQELIKKYPTLVTFTFSPYMTYMRFHAGENNFIYFLMKYVIKKLKSKNSRDAKQLIKRNKKEWYKNYIKRKDESSWHYVGLGVEIYQNEEIKRKADIVKDLINAIGEFGLLEDELNRELVPWGFRKIQETCNKFNERLVYYKAAVRKAGLDV